MDKIEDIDDELIQLNKEDIKRKGE